MPACHRFVRKRKQASRHTLYHARDSHTEGIKRALRYFYKLLKRVLKCGCYGYERATLPLLGADCGHSTISSYLEHKKSSELDLLRRHFRKQQPSCSLVELSFLVSAPKVKSASLITNAPSFGAPFDFRSPVGETPLPGGLIETNGWKAERL